MPDPDPSRTYFEAPRVLARQAPSPETDLALQRALADAVEAYGMRVREHGVLPPFPVDRNVAPTNVAITAAAMLKASDVYSFEIAAMFNV